MPAARAVAVAAVCGLVVASAGPPNIVYILADDLEWDYKQDRLALMPNLREKIVKEGTHFVNHVATVPVCGPSRSSLLAGRYPHNTGYFANLDKSSVAAFKKIQNNTVGTWLTKAGYHTAFIGKYVNGLEKEVSSGWSYWGSISSHQHLYNYYNASSWDVSFDDEGKEPVSEVKDKLWTGTHQADWIPMLAKEQIQKAKAKGKPFYLHLCPTMVHYGTCDGPHADESQYADDDPHWEKALPGCTKTKEFKCAFTASPCVSTRNRHRDDALSNPRVPSWNLTSSGTLPVQMQFDGLPQQAVVREDIAFRNRTGSVRDLDDMIGAVLAAVEDAGEMDNTYVIFTSDNGFHLGEHRMAMGKQHPYETDVRVPFYIKGPSVPKNAQVLHPTAHIDVTATIVDLAGATVQGPALDGKSFKSELAGGTDPKAWREFSFSEHFENDLTWWMIRHPLDGSTVESQTSFAWWCTGEAEVYDLKADPWQLANLVDPRTDRGHSVQAAYKLIGRTLSLCSGEDCISPTPAEKPSGKYLECKKTTRPGPGMDELVLRQLGKEADMAYAAHGTAEPAIFVL